MTIKLREARRGDGSAFVSLRTVNVIRDGVLIGRIQNQKRRSEPDDRMRYGWYFAPSGKETIIPGGVVKYDKGAIDAIVREYDMARR